MCLCEYMCALIAECVTLSACQRAPGGGDVTQFTASSCHISPKCLESFGTNEYRGVVNPKEGHSRRKWNFDPEVTDRESQTHQQEVSPPPQWS